MRILVATMSADPGAFGLDSEVAAGLAASVLIESAR